ncbi:MAG: hypothetical protein ACKOEP_05185 [Phycisphaerales bacterium]
MSRSVAVLIASLAGITMVLSKFLVPLGDAEVKVADWFNILAAIAFVLGGANLLKMNLLSISARGPGWGYSAVTLAAFLTTLGVGVLKVGVPPAAAFPNVPFSGEKDVAGSALWWLYEYAMSPITSTLFAMLAFYVASAAFRAFRAKNAAAIFLLATAFVVLLGRTYAGVLATSWIPHDNPWVSWLRLENLSAVIMSVFTNAGTRAMIIGIAIGVAATSLKIMLGLDRSYLGGAR